MDSIRDVILPEILERNRFKRSVRIWSAGCGNGAEPYSLAILVGRELKEHVDEWQVNIVGTDISQPSLLTAAEGEYGEWTLRSTPDDIRSECFLRDGQRWTIRPEYRRMVTFSKSNLAKPILAETSYFDLILCRNVMIYFSPALKRQLIRRFRDSLDNDGWLVVGAVEHDLESFQSFRIVPFPGATLYQKVAEPAGFLPQSKRVQDKAPQPAKNAAIPVPAARPDIDGLRRLADCGNWTNALGYCRQLLAVEALNPIVHFYHALVLEHTGLMDESEQALRRAIYLDRYFLLAHYHLGLCLTKDQKPRTAAKSFQNVLSLSTEMRDDQVVADGDGITVADLKGLARMHLQNLRIYDSTSSGR